MKQAQEAVIRDGGLEQPPAFTAALPNIPHQGINHMEYADDVCLVSHKYEHMQRKLDDLWKESKKAGLEMNSSKTEEIHVSTIVNQGLRLNGGDIKRSSDFCYLGSIVAENGSTSRAVNARIQKARGSFSKQKSVAI